VSKTYDGEKTASTNVTGNNSCMQKAEVRSMFSPCTKIKSKWIKDLNTRPETLKLVQERSGNKLEATGIGTDFLSRTQMSLQLRKD
jgi:hypothetical protein